MDERVREGPLPVRQHGARRDTDGACRPRPRPVAPWLVQQPGWPGTAFLCLFAAAGWSAHGLAVMALCRCLLELALAGGAYLPIGGRERALLGACHAGGFALLWLPVWLALCLRPGPARRLVAAATAASAPGYFTAGAVCLCL